MNHFSNKVFVNNSIENQLNPKIFVTMVYRPNRVRSSAPPFNENLTERGELTGEVGEEEPEEEEFIVEKLVGKRSRYNTTQYLVKWFGYDDSSNTWKCKSFHSLISDI